MRARGVSLAETSLLIATVITASFILVAFAASLMLNFRVDEKNILSEAQYVDPSITEVVSIRKNFIDYSEATVRDKKGRERKFLIDSNIAKIIKIIPVD